MIYPVTLYYKAVLLQDPNFVFTRTVTLHAETGRVKCLSLSFLSFLQGDFLKETCLFVSAGPPFSQAPRPETEALAWQSVTRDRPDCASRLGAPPLRLPLLEAMAFS